MIGGLLGRALVVAMVCVVLVLQTRPATALSRAYLCFFDEGRSELTPRCRLIMGEFADFWHRSRAGETVSNFGPFERSPAQVFHVTVQGSAPDAGSPAGNQRLGLLRALAVVEELRRLEIPDEFLTPVSIGADRPMVPHAPRDPQNRLVQLGWTSETQHAVTPRRPAPAP